MCQISPTTEIHFSECSCVSVNGFVYNVKQQLQAISRIPINSSNHLSDIGSINFKKITKFIFPKLPFAHKTVVTENVQFDLHTEF